MVYRERVGPWVVKKTVMQKMGIEQEDMIIFDVGAYVGDVTAFYQRMWPKASYYLFEPLPENVKVLRNRFRDTPTVHIIPKAVGSEAGKQIMWIGGQANEMSSLHQRPEDGRRYYRHLLQEGPEVEVITLDDFMEDEDIKKVHVLKADIQGGELNMLKGFIGGLRYKRALMVYMEVFFTPMYDGAPLLWEMWRVLDHYKYSLFDLYVLGRARVNRQLKYGDVLFVSPQVREEVLDTYPEEWIPSSKDQAIG